MSLALAFDAPFSSAVASTPLVPDPYPVSIAGRPFLIDDSADLPRDQHSHASVQYLTKYLTSPVFGSPTSVAEVGETSLNPDIHWRRGTSQWHKGAGQNHLDVRDSDRALFRSSKGIDPWTVGQFSLLHDTTKIKTSTNTNLKLTTAGTYLYLADGANLTYSTDAATWSSAVTGLTGTIKSVTSDGHTIWVSIPGGVYTTTRGASSASSYNALVPDLIAYRKGRLVASVGPALYNITSTTEPTALFTHDNSDWVWTGFATGDSCIYASGWSGDYSAVYRIPIKADGSGLDAPIQAAELPKGETALSITGYLSFVLIGTSRGIRLATQASSGELQLGSVIEAGPVRCGAGYGQWVWFGWENYDTTSTGLGRCDLTVINTDAPAYASDLMATTQGSVLSCVIFNGTPVFAVSGVGVFAQSADLVPSGSLDSGLVTFDLPDPKVAQAVDVRHSNPLQGSHSLYLSTDSGGFALLGTHTPTTQETPFSANDAKGEVFEIRHTLTRGTDPTTGPTISRWTLMAIAAALSGEQMNVPLLITSYDNLDTGGAQPRNPADDLAFLKGLRVSKLSFAYQEGGTTYRAVMSDYTWLPTQLTQDRSAWLGTFIAQLLVQQIS